MKVCVRAIPSTLSKGIQRVALALERYAPEGVTIVQEPKDADLWVLHVIGHGSMEEVPQYQGKIAMVQYCLLTTEDSRPEAWLPYWQRAEAVWSYYDLIQYAFDRGTPLPVDVNFYHAPLGVDSSVFQPSVPVRKRFVIGTSGYVADTECAGECAQAAFAAERMVFHLGPNLNLGKNAVYAKDLSDEDVAEFWSQCSYVAGLRRIEGFELPVLEGLACGARPICFDAPHYRQWFGEHAEYIQEGSKEDVTAQLTDIFRGLVRVVTPAERDEVVRNFNWSRLAGGFWDRILAGGAR